MTLLWNALALLAAYLIGSLSFAVIVSRVMGLDDPRSYGSGNPGATNVLRSGNKKAALLTLLFDLLKGLLPVAALNLWGERLGVNEGGVALAGLAAFLGHLFPVFFRFIGGKGVATALGVIVGINPLLGLAVGATWLIVAFFSRYSSLASLVAAVFAPVYYVFGDGVAWYADNRVLLSMALMTGLLIWRHAENISRLFKGTESRLGKKKGA